MSPDRLRRLYGGLLIALFAALALWRWDLFWGAFCVTLRQVREGGPARWRVLAEVALFSGILGLTWRALLLRADLVRDATMAALAAFVGFAAEAWGTRAGLWTYYTGERPPAWIVPAWPMGALVVERLALWAEQRWGSGPGAGFWRTGYRLLAASCAAVVLVFCWPWLHIPGTWAVLALVVAALAFQTGGERDSWRLGVGLCTVLLADTWGTTNGCWRYYTQLGGVGGLAAGVAFGMAFDASLVLGCLKLADFLL